MRQRQPVKIGSRSDEVSIKQLIDQFFSDTVQFKRSAPVQNGTAGACVAQQIRALEKGAFQNNGASTSRAGRRDWNGFKNRQRPFEGLSIGVEATLKIVLSGGSEGLFNLGDDIPTPDDEDFVADVDAEAIHLAHVVQRGVLYGHPAHPLRCNARNRRDVARASGLPLHIKKHGEGLLRWELPR